MTPCDQFNAAYDAAWKTFDTQCMAARIKCDSVYDSEIAVARRVRVCAIEDASVHYSKMLDDIYAAEMRNRLATNSRLRDQWNTFVSQQR